MFTLSSVVKIFLSCEKPNKTIASHLIGVSAILQIIFTQINNNRHSVAKENKMAKINKDLKKAATLAKKLIIDRDRILKSSDKIQKILLTTDLVIGGYKMVQKLRKQKNIFDELADVMNKRIALFQDVAAKASEEK